MQQDNSNQKRKTSAAVFFALSSRKLLNWMPDQRYLSALWRAYFHKRFDWKNPITFNEKIQWLKVKDRNPLYPTLVDKYAVREWITSKIGEQYLIPLVGGPWNSFDEIDFASLPNQFVLKCTHDSGNVIICHDKRTLDLAAAKEKIEKSLKQNYYYGGREWPYQYVQPRIIAEQYMESASSGELLDYKLMMFDGEYHCAFVCSNRFAGSKLNVTFFDPDWQRMPFERLYHADPQEIPRPFCYDEMIDVARILSSGLPFVRVDLYEINRRAYFGEMTLYPGSGLETFQPEKWDNILGGWIDLKKFFPGEFES
ncbi:MAG: ATP-grasp fold amidoligase family protein [Christensenella sp.]|nr:ATP-grasp fold amidoligase family protein [Christensenella sp.]